MIDTVRGGLLERERELAMFDSALDGTGRGIGSLVLIDGPAGIGKTRLLAAARTRAAERGLAAFTARGSDLERDFAFGVVRQLFGNVVARERESVLAGVATYVASIFGQHPRGDELGQAPSASALQHALFWLVANLPERAPLLLAVEDAHWADEPSLRFLHYMARRVEEVPVTMVLVIRAESADMRSEMVSRIAAEPAAVLMSLHALTVSAAKTLVRLLVSPDVDERLCEACYAATGGNPLLLSELARALVETGLPAAAQDIRGVERLVPRAVARHVLVRLARQPPSATALAQAVAVLGSGVEPRHAAALAGLDESAAAEAIDSLVAADILAPERPLGFLHPLLREVIYAELAPGKRAMTHRRAARLLADAGAEPQRTASQVACV